ncbi:MAG: cysteine-rich CWC family protein [Solirubrobacteraceae bacterium]
MSGMPTTSAVCPRCSGPLRCGIDSGLCWCAEVTVSDARRAAFAKYYDGCLCRGCLEALDEDHPQAPTVRAFLAGQLRRRPGRKD